MMMEGGTWRSVEETSGEGTVKSRAAEKRAAQTEGVRTMCKLHNTALELRCGRAISAVGSCSPPFFFSHSHNRFTHRSHTENTTIHLTWQ